MNQNQSPTVCHPRPGPVLTCCDNFDFLWEGRQMGDFIAELLAFMKERKKFWLAPIVIVFLLLGGLIVLTQGSAMTPFIYTLF
jgi:hypothetical protein